VPLDLASRYQAFISASQRLFAIAALGGALSMRAAAQEGPRPPHGTAFQPASVHVAIGSRTAALDYYRTTLQPQVGLTTGDTIFISTVDDLLEYMGYPTLPGRDLHRLPSNVLMSLGDFGDILATRFFSPKITDVAEKPSPHPENGYGWRKLVRLKAKSGSTADANSIEALYFLQNITTPDPQTDPFDPENAVSLQNQAILIRRLSPGEPTDARRAAYFLTYESLVVVDRFKKPVKGSDGEFVDNGRISFGLAATFDEDDREPETNSRPREYFVPAACIECHGGSGTRGKLNFLDTDAWLDRVFPVYGVEASAPAYYQEEDFTAMAASPFGVLYDGGTDPSSPEFATAFSVLRELNEEIRSQNAAAGGANFTLRAVEKWLQLHATSTAHVPPYERGFGAQPWDPNSQTHRKALYFLGRYCYRCHSSVRYNVFDRVLVKDKIDNDSLRERVLDVSDPDFWMPQDRIVPGLQTNGPPTGPLAGFVNLIDAVDAEP
jgi:hypothetical protein